MNDHATIERLRHELSTSPNHSLDPATLAAIRRDGGRRRVTRRAASGLTTVAAAAAVVTAVPGGPAANPAYAVELAPDGDVVVTIHSLEDSAGLEQALHEHGIDATVVYDTYTWPDVFDDGFDPSELDLRKAEGANSASGDPDPGGEAGNDEPAGGEAGPGAQQPAPDDGEKPEQPVEEAQADMQIWGCGLQDSEDATLTQEGGDWVLRIPADSPMQDRKVLIDTHADGDLKVFYEGTVGTGYEDCGLRTDQH